MIEISGTQRTSCCKKHKETQYCMQKDKESWPPLPGDFLQFRIPSRPKGKYWYMDVELLRNHEFVTLRGKEVHKLPLPKNRLEMDRLVMTTAKLLVASAGLRIIKWSHTIDDGEIYVFRLGPKGTRRKVK